MINQRYSYYKLYKLQSFQSYDSTISVDYAKPSYIPHPSKFNIATSRRKIPPFGAGNQLFKSSELVLSIRLWIDYNPSH